MGTGRSWRPGGGDRGVLQDRYLDEGLPDLVANARRRRRRGPAGRAVVVGQIVKANVAKKIGCRRLIRLSASDLVASMNPLNQSSFFGGVRGAMVNASPVIDFQVFFWSSLRTATAFSPISLRRAAIFA